MYVKSYKYMGCLCVCVGGGRQGFRDVKSCTQDEKGFALIRYEMYMNTFPLS